MTRQCYIGVELGGRTWPQFSWEEMPGWGTSVDEDVVDVHCSSSSDSGVLELVLVFLGVWGTF